MTTKALRLRDFLEDFVDDHALVGEDEVLLDVTPEEVEDLGNFFVRGICGWMQGLKKVRQQQRTVDSALTADEENDGDKIEETDFLN